MTELQKMMADAVRMTLSTEGISHQDFAAEIGCTPKHLSRMLGGYNGGSFELWEAMLKHLGIRLWWTRSDERPFSGNDGGVF